MTAEQAARAANEMRNEIMDMARARSSDIGKAYAKQLKGKGKALDELLQKYAKQKFSQSFEHLPKQAQKQVLLEVVDAAGRPNPKVNVKAARMGSAGHILWVLTAAIAIYNIGTAEDKTEATIREGVNLGGGFLGGAAGGALAGIWFGPLGIAVGAAVGGILGAVISDETYVYVRSTDDASVDAIVKRYAKPFYTDEKGMATALYNECGINTYLVHAVLVELYKNYRCDSDDVAFEYVQLVKKGKDSIRTALKLHQEVIDFLIRLLDEGWTTKEEYQAIEYLKKM